MDVKNYRSGLEVNATGFCALGSGVRLMAGPYTRPGFRQAYSGYRPAEYR